MEFEEVIKKRRSIRKFLSVPVPREIIARIIQVGNEAPCAGNIINWWFVIVEDEQMKKNIAQAALEQFWIATAPTLIVVCSVNDQLEKFYGLRGEKLYSIQNCSAAIENMLLEVVNLGLASCWVSAFDENAVIRELNCPESVRPQAILPIGYPGEINPRPMRFTIEDVTYINRWGNPGKLEFEDAFLRNYRLLEKAHRMGRNWLEKLKSFFVR